MNEAIDLSDLFASFQSKAFRVEVLPEYKVPEETEALRQFEQTGILPSGFNADWVSFVGEVVKSGRQVQRIRLLSKPLSSYERFELLAYRDAISAGQDVRFTARESHPPVQDFWVFDDKWIARMNYGPDGSWLGATVLPVIDEDRTAITYWKSIFASSSSDMNAWH